MLRNLLWRVATLIAGWALILAGVAGLSAWAHRPEIVLVCLALIGAGILIGLIAQVSLPPSPSRHEHPSHAVRTHETALHPSRPIRGETHH